jgi:hypothetical protein
MPSIGGKVRVTVRAAYEEWGANSAGRPFQRRGPARFGSYRKRRDIPISTAQAACRASPSAECEPRHKPGFEEPIIFWTPREAPLLCPIHLAIALLMARSERSCGWVKKKSPDASAATREAEEVWS